MIVVENLRKRFGNVLAVDGLSFNARPGVVTGFLGPNGSGKSTTMRCMLGLDQRESGTATFNGRAYRDLRRPLHEVGALLDAGYVHPGRSGRNHLRWVAATNGISRRRVDDVLEQVGLTQAAGRRVKGYSLGMRQRLGLAAVLLGDPHTVVLDEPANGLDPEGVRWIRDVLVHLAGQGRTVFVSSHLLSEMALMAQDLVVIGRGHLIDQCPLADFVERHSERWVRVRSPQMAVLRGALARGGGAHVRDVDAATVDVFGVDAAFVGQAAADAQVVLHELSPQTGSLEDAFLRATASTQEYRSQGLTA
jgi:ABC-2 type transport system ATP-binding protein